MLARVWIRICYCVFLTTEVIFYQIYGNGYGGQVINETAEEVNFKHMVICKNEVNEHNNG